MPRTSQFPIILNECKTLSLQHLRQQGYLKRNSCTSGSFSWHRGSTEPELTVGITVVMKEIEGDLILSYYIGNRLNLSIYRLSSMASNLQHGIVFYIICPNTGKRCRKLFFIEDRFIHRPTHGSYYKSQIYSKRLREWKIHLDVLLIYKQVKEIIHKPYFKPYYKTQPTRTMKRLEGSIRGLYLKSTDPFVMTVTDSLMQADYLALIK